jgi:curved DNA-binding protein CbpA
MWNPESGLGDPTPPGRCNPQILEVDRMNESPYEILGVEKTSDAGEVRRAYRKKAKKTHTGNNAGDQEEFLKVYAAYKLLTDVHKREQYDRTGKWESDRPDNELADIFSVFSQALAATMQGLMERNLDPKTQDIVQLMRNSILGKIKETREQRKQPTKIAETYKAIVDRFSTDGPANHLENIARDHLRNIEIHLQAIDSDLAKVEKALAFLKHFAFRRDVPPPSSSQTFTDISALFQAMRDGTSSTK